MMFEGKLFYIAHLAIILTDYSIVSNFTPISFYHSKQEAAYQLYSSIKILEKSVWHINNTRESMVGNCKIRYLDNITLRIGRFEGQRAEGNTTGFVRRLSADYLGEDTVSSDAEWCNNLRIGDDDYDADVSLEIKVKRTDGGYEVHWLLERTDWRGRKTEYSIELISNNQKLRLSSEGRARVLERLD